MAFGGNEEEAELKFKAAVFGLEGVIAETAPYEVDAWKNVAGEHGVTTDDWEERWKELGEDGLMEWILERSQLPESATKKKELLLRQAFYYNKGMQELSPKDLSPGMIPLLKNLKKNGVRIAATSTKENAGTAIDKLEIGDFFDEIIDGVTAGEEQSLLEQMLTAAKELNTTYEKVIVIVDVKKLTLGKDTELFVVGVGSSEPVEGSDWTVGTTGELTYESLKEQFLKNR